MGSGKFRSKSRLMTATCFALSLLAILLWGRLKLVTGVPRTAYADPNGKGTAPTPRAGNAGRPAQARPAR